MTSEITRGTEGNEGLSETFKGAQGPYPNRVRELRENQLMTQAQLARQSKLALRTIHSVEKGMKCRMDTKRKVLLGLGLRFEDRDLVFPSVKKIKLAPMEVTATSRNPSA